MIAMDPLIRRPQEKRPGIESLRGRLSPEAYALLAKSVATLQGAIREYSESNTPDTPVWDFEKRRENALSIISDFDSRLPAAEKVAKNNHANLKSVIGGEFMDCCEDFPEVVSNNLLLTDTESLSATASNYAEAMRKLDEVTDGVAKAMAEKRRRLVRLIENYYLVEIYYGPNGETIIRDAESEDKKFDNFTIGDVVKREEELLDARIGGLKLPLYRDGENEMGFTKKIIPTAKGKQYKFIDGLQKKGIGGFTDLAGKDRESIIEDHATSVKYAMLRGVLGYRKVDLDRAHGVLDRDQIDRFQRDHVMSDQEVYLIALTPEEWIKETQNSVVNEVLYGRGSDISKYLEKSEGAFHRPYRLTRRSDRKRLASDADNEFKKHAVIVEEGYVEMPDADYDWKSKESDDKDGSNSGIRPEETEETEEEQVLSDVLLYIDLKLKVKDRDNCLSKYRKIIKDTAAAAVNDSKAKLGRNVDPGKRREIVLRLMLAKLHPDRNPDNAGVGELSKYISAIYGDLKKEKAAEI